LQSFDAVLIATHHDAFDWAMVAANARLVVDTRGVYANPAPNIVQA
jgi:UDP-N-acetyl-D-glucosamine dehydrogenase